MLKFNDIATENPKKESSSRRKNHFNEIYAKYAKQYMVLLD